jgi:hypothetical protein
MGRERPPSIRQEKSTWRVVLGEAKLHSATEAARHRRLHYVAHMVEQLPSKESAVGSIPTIDKTQRLPRLYVKDI